MPSFSLGLLGGLFGAGAAGGATSFLGLAGDAAAASAAGGISIGSLTSGLSILGGGLQAISSITQGNAASENAQFQSEIAKQNQKIGNMNAQQATQVGEAQTEQQQQKTRATVGAIQAAQGASGIDVNSGSAVDVRSSASELGELDALTIRSNAARTAYGFEVNAQNQGAEAELLQQESQQAQIGGDLGAGGSLLSGASSAGRNYLAWQSSGNPMVASFL